MAEIRLRQRSDTPAAVASNVVLFTDTDGNLNIRKPDGSILELAAAGNFTFTIPATGTAALLGTAQTFSAAQTFSSAITSPGIAPAADATNAVRVLKADKTTAVLTVNTTNSKVNVAALQIGGVDVPYEAGTWTPVLSFATGGSTGITYTSAAGDYVRIGALCYVRFEFTLSSKGTGTGVANVGGLPFPAATSNRGGLTEEFRSNVSSVTSNIIARISTNTMRPAQISGDLTDANFTNTTVLRMWGVYRI